MTIKINFEIPSEAIRSPIRGKADDVRHSWGKKGIFDIFDILQNSAILIRKPLEEGLSGFTTYFKGNFAVILNSKYTLGHERFSGAHELYHITYNQDVLKREYLLTANEVAQIDNEANIFAAEFLMPEDGIREIFGRIVNVTPEKVQVKHVVRLQNTFKVSYAAMVKRLYHLQLCTKEQYSILREFGSQENAKKLLQITKIEGFSGNLLLPSNVNLISAEYLNKVRNNYESGKISYGKLKALLKYLNLEPKDLGYFPEGDE